MIFDDLLNIFKHLSTCTKFNKCPNKKQTRKTEEKKLAKQFQHKELKDILSLIELQFIL